MNIVRLDTADIPSPAGSGELLLADEGHLHLVFWGMSRHVGVATFVNYAQLIFGYPNDEAREGVFPELEYAFYEILDSDWNASLTEQNRIVFPDSRVRFNRRHFLVTCHETTLQVLASDICVDVKEGPFRDVAAAVLNRQIDSEGITVTPSLDPS